MRICKGTLAKANLIASAQLSCHRKIDRDHVRDFRITANGLAISEQQDRFAAWRDLDRARSNRFRDKIDPLRARWAANCVNWLGRPAPSIRFAMASAPFRLKELPASDGFGDKFISFQPRTFETHPHSIRIGRNHEFVGRKALNRYIV